MPEQQSTLTYSDRVKEVFIKPIRSVLAIDDLFPTLDGYLSSPGVPTNNDYANRLKKLVEFCRRQSPQWLVDVHDGKSLGEGKLPLSSIRQCDWLVLDFKLDGEDGGGRKAIEIIRELAGSDHFNLVVIYTDEASDSVLHEVTANLARSVLKKRLTLDERADVEKRLDFWEDSKPDIRGQLQRHITYKVRFSLIKNGASIQHIRNVDVLKTFIEELQGSKFVTVQDREFLLRYLIEEAEKRVTVGENNGFCITACDDTAEVKWLLVENAFLAIVSKDTPPEELISKLHLALVNWRPSPNRLVLAKLRAELDARGIRADEEVLLDRDLQAFWLRLLLEAKEKELFHYVGELVDRQTELLTDRVRQVVVEFTENVIALFRSDSNVDSVIDHFWGKEVLKPGSKEEGMLAHNTYVSTKPPSGKNLVPGHIMRIAHDGDPSYWICLSPACDLEAGRDTGRDLKKRVRPWMPFTGVKLHKVAKLREGLLLATGGWLLFPMIDGDRQCFSFFPEAKPNRNPVWEEFFAEDDGRLTEGEPRIKIIRIVPPPQDGALPSFQPYDALIVAQLRSEYATNLTLKLTHHLSRIGLDYLSPPETKSDASVVR